jgi:uncharacterized membrane protein
MNEKPTNSSPKNLSGRAVLIILSIFGLILTAICFVVGAWPLAIGFLLLPIFFIVYSFLFGRKKNKKDIDPSSNAGKQ